MGFYEGQVNETFIGLKFNSPTKNRESEQNLENNKKVFVVSHPSFKVYPLMSRAKQLSFKKTNSTKCRSEWLVNQT